jgi:hypothetical protein
MDWLKDFEERFNNFPEIQKLKAGEFHGALEINFNAGIPQNYNLKIHRRYINQPLQKGDNNAG